MYGPPAPLFVPTSGLGLGPQYPLVHKKLEEKNKKKIKDNTTSSPTGTIRADGEEELPRQYMHVHMDVNVNVSALHQVVCLFRFTLYDNLP